MRGGKLWTQVSPPTERRGALCKGSTVDEEDLKRGSTGRDGVAVLVLAADGERGREARHRVREARPEGRGARPTARSGRDLVSGPGIKT